MPDSVHTMKPGQLIRISAPYEYRGKVATYLRDTLIDWDVGNSFAFRIKQEALELLIDEKIVELPYFQMEYSYINDHDKKE